MKKAVLFMLLVFTNPLLAAEQTAQLSVPGMNCPVCPITVKKSLQGVKGVISASVDYDSKTATVRFDDQLTTTESLREATQNVGYPSTVVEPRK